MDQRELGTSGLRISAIGLGCMGMSQSYGPLDDEESVRTLHRAHRVHPIMALQSEYSLWTREPERAVIPACRDLRITFVPFSPLGRGFLTGAVKELETLTPGDVRRRLPRFEGENLQRNLA